MTIAYVGTIVGIGAGLAGMITAFSRMFISIGILTNEIKELKKDVARLEIKMDEHNNFGVRIAVLEHSDREKMKQIQELSRGKGRQNDT